MEIDEDYLDSVFTTSRRSLSFSINSSGFGGASLPLGNVELEEAGALLYFAMQVRQNKAKNFLDNADNILCRNTYILIVS